MTQHDSKVDIRDYWRILLRRKWWFIVPVLAAVITGGIFAFTAKPVYRSDVTFTYRRPPELTRGLGELVGSRSIIDASTDMRDRLTSTEVLRKVIETTGLKEQDGAARHWARANRERFPGKSEDELTELRLVHDLPNAIKAGRGRSDVVTISIEQNDPAAAQRIAQALANAFLIATSDTRTEEMKAGKDFSERQLAVYKAELDSAEAALARATAVRAVMSREVVSDANAPLLRTLIATAQLEADEAQRRARERTSAGAAGASPELAGLVPRLTSSPRVAPFVARLDSLEEQSAISDLTAGADQASQDLTRSLRMQSLRVRRELTQAFTEEASALSPDTPAAELEGLAAEALVQVDAGRKQHRHDYLEALLGAYEARTRQTTDSDLHIEELRRARDNANSIYQMFLTQSMASSIRQEAARDSLQDRFEILDPASLPLDPVRPDRPLIVILSLACGVIIGLAAVFVVEYHDSGFRNVEEIERELGAEILATIPRIEEIRKGRSSNHDVLKSGRVITETSRVVDHVLAVESPAAFEMRKLLLRLRQEGTRELPRTILVTSSQSGEGKSMAALLLASELARFSSEPVALVDFDLRRPSLDSMLKLDANGSNVSRALYEGETGALIPLEVGQGTLNLLPAGYGPHPPSELLNEDRIRLMLGHLRERYGYVVLDSPPCLPTPDPLLFAKLVDATIFVVRAGTVPRDVVRRGLRLQRGSEDNLIGIVVNDASEVLPYHYQYRRNPYAYRSTSGRQPAKAAAGDDAQAGHPAAGPDHPENEHAGTTNGSGSANG